MKRAVFSVLVLVLHCVYGLAHQKEEKPEPYSFQEVPAWVTRADILSEPILPVKSSEAGYQSLLEDVQINALENVIYIHKVNGVLTQTAAEQLGCFTIEFDPIYQTVRLHRIRVLRGQSISDRSGKVSCKLIQKEEELTQSGIYTGSLSLVCFIDDIRIGDVVEFEYSIAGANPYFASHVGTSVYFQDSSSMQRVRLRILASADRPLFSKSFFSSIEPSIREIALGVQEWVWEDYNTAPVKLEDSLPAWFNPYARIQVSQYASWEEVAAKYRALYELPFNLSSEASEEMVALIEAWKTASLDPAERALTALRFVQDEIRYLALAEGMMGCQPMDPRVVLEKRWGDCKGKSLLLKTLLALMDIDASPVLVNPSGGRQLFECLPSTGAFGHCVLQIHLIDGDYLVDPVYSLQGGNLQKNYCPSYTWGLVLRPGSEGLKRLCDYTIESPVEIETDVVLTGNVSADVVMLLCYRGHEADRRRRFINNAGLNRLADMWKDTLRRSYGSIEMNSAFSLVDDRESNTLILQSSYRVPIRTRGGTKKFKIYSVTMERWLDTEVLSDRKYPYSLGYPLWVRESLRITRDTHRGEERSECIEIQEPFMQFGYFYESIGGQTEIGYELKTLRDHVLVEEMPRYQEALEAIEDAHVEGIVLEAHR